MNRWWGKLIGGVLGYLLGGPYWALAGLAVGHLFDRRRRLRLRWDSPRQHQQAQSVFFNTTFSVMGHVAKFDGRVSENEIAFARAVMEHMALSGERRREAMRLFTAGKAADFPLETALEIFRRVVRRQRQLLPLFLEIQLQAAYADGDMDPATRGLLRHIGHRLGVSQRRFAQLEARVRSARQFAGPGYAGTGERQRQGPAPPPMATRGDRLAEAYGVLGLEPPVADEAVKRAYRRLMNQHHPDKLVARGVAEERVRQATEKTREIKEAYERIRKARNMGK